MNDNIGRGTREGTRRAHLEALKEEEDDEDDDDVYNEDSEALVLDFDAVDLSEEARQAAFQAQYKHEMNRQMKLLQIEAEATGGMGSPNKVVLIGSSPPVVTDNEDNNIEWEDA